MGEPAYPLFSVFAFISFVIVLIPLPWHLQAWNSGTCLYMIWVAVACLNSFINSIIWRDNVIDSAPLFCDISTRITVGVAVAIPAASLCINRRLYKIASCASVSITPADKRRAILIDLAIGLGIPFLQMALQFIVQGHRYDIWEGVGCYPTTVNTPAAYPLSFVWPNVIGLVSGVYCVLTLREFMKRRAQFSQFINSTTSLSVNRYFRLMCLATAELIFNIPISTYGLYLNITTQPIYPWKSWSDIHFDWYIIDTFPALVWRSSRVVTISLELSRWSLVLCAFVFFGFFGFANEARKHYALAYRAVAKRFGILPPPRSIVGSKISPGLKEYGKGPFKPTISKPIFIARSFELSATKESGFVSSVADRSSYPRSASSETSLPPSPSDEIKVEVPLTPETPTSSTYSTFTIHNVDPFKSRPHDSPV